MPKRPASGPPPGARLPKRPAVAPRVQKRPTLEAITRFVEKTSPWLAAKIAEEAGRKLVDKAVEKVMPAVGTQTGRPKKGVVSTGRARGFTRRYKRKKFYRKKYLKKYTDNGGVLKTVEQGGLLDGGQILSKTNQAIYIGHATCPIREIELLAWIAFIKTFMAKMGVDVRDIEIAPNWKGNMKIQYWINENNNSLNTKIFVFDYAKSMVVVAQEMRDWFTHGVITPLDRVVFDGLWMEPDGDQPRYYPLKYTKITLNIKSTLKLQNRSINTLDNQEADDVDNVPLYGKLYFGNGTGAILNSFAPGPRDFLCESSEAGKIVVCPIGTMRGVQEPPVPSMFKYVKTAKSVKFEPGDIKTDTLVFKKTYDFQYLMHLLLRESDQDRKLLPFGKFSFFGLEKMLVAQFEAVPGIKAAYEINWRCGVHVNNYMTRNTLELFSGSVQNH